MTTITLITAEAAAPLVARYESLDEAATHQRVSASTIRRRARALGVARVSGRAVRGYIRIDGAGRAPSVVAYSA